MSTENYGVGPETSALEAVLNDVIRVVEPDPDPQPVEQATAGIDEGEKEVVILSASLQPDAISLLDDQAGRRAAKRLAIPMMGTAGLLLVAKQDGLIDTVCPLLHAICRLGQPLGTGHYRLPGGMRIG